MRSFNRQITLPHLNRLNALKTGLACIFSFSSQTPLAFGLQDTTTVNKDYDVIGFAYNQNQELVYTESYSFNLKETLVIYKSSQGQLLAAKSLNYSLQSPYQPNTTIYDHTKKQKLELTTDSKNLKLESISSSNQRELLEATPKKNKLIIDAAFDQYIRNEWQSLKRREHKIHFTLAQQGKIFNVTLKQDQTKNCSAQSNTCFSLTPSNWLAKLIAGKTYLGYDDQKRLQYFHGPINSFLSSSREKITIHYQYPDEASTPNTSNLSKAGL